MGVRQHLAGNLKRLMDAPGSKYPTAQAVQDASERLSCKIGRSTVQRMRDGSTPVNLDYVEALARVFGVEAWQLLLPAAEEDFESLQQTTLDQSIAALAEALDGLSDVGREFAGPLLLGLAKSPTEAGATVELLETLLRVHSRGGDPNTPGPPSKRAGASAPSAAAKAPSRKAALVLKIGGGTKQQFELPLHRSAFRPGSASKAERHWYEGLKTVPKASGGI